MIKCSTIVFWGGAKSDIVECCYSLIFLQLSAFTRLPAGAALSCSGREAAPPIWTVPVQLIQSKFFLRAKEEFTQDQLILGKFFKKKDFWKKIFFFKKFNTFWTWLNRLLLKKILGWIECFPMKSLGSNKRFYRNMAWK